MKVELLRIDECPNWGVTLERLRQALDSVGRSADNIEVVVLRTSAEASEHPFAGSPTILLDGIDPFPSGGAITDLACRVYQTDEGLAGSPTVEQLIRVLDDRG